MTVTAWIGYVIFGLAALWVLGHIEKRRGKRFDKLSSNVTDMRRTLESC